MYYIYNMSAEMSESKILHGWFSQEQKECIYRSKNKEDRKPNTNIYLTVDGIEVEITEVCYEMYDHKKNFPDSKYLGKVTKWLRVHYD